MKGRVAVITGGSRGSASVSRAASTNGARGSCCAPATPTTRRSPHRPWTPRGDRARRGRARLRRGRRPHPARGRPRALGALDVLVNNAAANPHFGPTHTVDQGRWQKIMEVNLWAPLRWTQLALEAGLGRPGPDPS
ncbi:SDR family NAD(P)-dependent oxidoreductase [Streptomyces sp. INA 01156]